MPLVGVKKKLKLLVIPVLSSILALMILFTNSFWKLTSFSLSLHAVYGGIFILNYFKTKGYGILSRLTRGCSSRPLLALRALIHTSCRESRHSSSASHRGRFYRPTQILTRQVIIYDTIRKALRLRTTFTQTSTLLACQGRDVKKMLCLQQKFALWKRA